MFWSYSFWEWFIYSIVIRLNFPLSESWFCILSRGQIEIAWFDHHIFWVLLVVPVTTIRGPGDIEHFSQITIFVISYSSMKYASRNLKCWMRVPFSFQTELWWKDDALFHVIRHCANKDLCGTTSFMIAYECSVEEWRPEIQSYF